MKNPLLFLIACTILPFGCSAKRPVQLGVTDGNLYPCPSSPNCVSSQSIDKAHYIDPIPFSGDIKTAKDRIVDILNTMERTRIITQNDTYLHAECTSALFRFVDDIEFYLDNTEKQIHVRSASRLGYSDLGVNRKRIEQIRSAFGTEPHVY